MNGDWKLKERFDQPNVRFTSKGSQAKFDGISVTSWNRGLETCGFHWLPKNNCGFHQPGKKHGKYGNGFGKVPDLPDLHSPRMEMFNLFFLEYLGKKTNPGNPQTFIRGQVLWPRAPRASRAQTHTGQWKKDAHGTKASYQGEMMSRRVELHGCQLGHGATLGHAFLRPARIPATNLATGSLI